MPRIDIMIVWPHGLQYRDEIINMIDDDEEGFRVQAIYRRSFSVDLIDKVYDSDSYPLEHLRSKSNYLREVGGDTVAVIIIFNEEPDERTVGEGPYRHVQCSRFVALKNKIRERYNPPDRPHDHVIHGTDYETQARHHLKLFGLVGEPRAWYSPILTMGGENFLCSPFLSKQFRHCRLCELSLLSLVCQILERGMCRIEDTPHYKFCAGDREPYVSYWDRHWGDSLCENHTPGRFDRLLSNRSWWDHAPICCMVRGGHIVIVDGLHRSAALLYNGILEVQAVIPIDPGGQDDRSRRQGPK